jgi:hypothetical protein
VGVLLFESFGRPEFVDTAGIPFVFIRKFLSWLLFVFKELELALVWIFGAESGVIFEFFYFCEG